MRSAKRAGRYGPRIVPASNGEGAGLQVGDYTLRMGALVDTLGDDRLTDPVARIRDMDAKGIDVMGVTISPLFYLFFGLQIFNASGSEFLAYTSSYMVVNLIMQNYLYGKYRWPWISELYEFIQSVYLLPAIISVILFHQALDLYSFLGIFVLFGVVKKNAILQIDHTNKLRERGMPRLQAILQANKDRLRALFR